jgi:exosome complex component RRP45
MGIFDCLRMSFLDIHDRQYIRMSRRLTLIDPNSDEERLMDGFVSISMNQHREICGIHMGGKISLKKEQLDICTTFAFKKVLELTDRIRRVVADYYR